mmetsp:Transcript_12719/g.39019  ORF Transcript_12719/g.39019 Transcript_12719/m.39019 type:complete len:403 (+) Transcript_12719:295-1503(+)
MRDFVDESGMVDSMDALAVCARAGKRQRMSMEKMDTAVEQMRTRLASVREEVLALQGQMDVEGEKGRQERLRELVKSVSKTVAEQQKEIIEAQKVLFKNWYSEAKNVDAKTVPNIEKRCFPTRRLGTDNIMQAVTKHFYRQGKFQIAEKLVEESKTEIQDAENTSMPFTTMTTIVEALKSHDVEPAISWAKTRRTELRKHGSSLEFALHRLVFLGFVQKGDWQGAISYAKAKFGDFSETQMGDIQSLMGCLLYINRLDKSPYASLFLPSQWTDTIRNFKRDYCKILGVPRNSPLCTTVTAATKALPRLLKAQKIFASEEDWRSSSDIPLEIDLGSECQFHSLFTCPVMRVEASPENPPMMLPCGHVLCRSTLNRLPIDDSLSFKCPYCPRFAYFDDCQQINF